MLDVLQHVAARNIDETHHTLPIDIRVDMRVAMCANEMREALRVEMCVDICVDTRMNWRPCVNMRVWVRV